MKWQTNTIFFAWSKQSLSTTADHDPDNVVAITPAKRSSDEGYGIELMSPENLGARFSSTTKPRIIKTAKSWLRHLSSYGNWFLHYVAGLGVMVLLYLRFTP